MKSKAYRALDVNAIQTAVWLPTRSEFTSVLAGTDIGKEWIYCILRWGNDDFDRPWKVRNPADIDRLVALLREVAVGRELKVAMEPTGTYGDALRQALERAGIPPQRVSPKHASDYAEVFDSVPSQHDGKDAAVVAELVAQGRSWPWPLAKPTEVEQEIGYHVDWMDGQRRQKMQWCGRLEALLSRYWPEATGIVSMTSATLLHCVVKYGGPAGLAGDPQGEKEVRRCCKRPLADEKIKALVASAAATKGVEMGKWEQERVRQYARIIQECDKQTRESVRRLKELAAGHTKIEAMGKVVGVATACVLWDEMGDPEKYSCGAAYRKGINLAERSSGKWQGQLKLSKRGSSKVRRWLYLAALRQVKDEPVKSWYARQKAARRGEGKPAVIGIMRKLALALYRVGGRGEKYDRKQLYQSVVQEGQKEAASA
jgi:transposase